MCQTTVAGLLEMISMLYSLHCPQAQDARHLVRHGPEGQLRSEILASRLSPWYLAVTFSACFAGGIQELDFFFGEMTSMSFRIQRSAWFDSGYMHCVTLRSSLKKLTYFLVVNSGR